VADHALATISNPDSALTDFTLIVDLENLPQDWWDAVTSSDGTRGRVYKSDGSTRLACDWIDFDDTAETGLLRVLWSGTLASTGTQQLWIEPPVSGNATVAADNTYGSDNAYDTSWDAYYPDGGTTDRTSNDRDGTAAGSPSIGGATGKIGNATDFDGSDDEIDLDSGWVGGYETLTVLAWGKSDASTGEHSLCAIWDGGASTSAFLLEQSGTVVLGAIRQSTSNQVAAANGGSLSTDTWFHAGLRYHRANELFNVVLNGAQIANDNSDVSDSVTLQTSPLDNAYIGTNDTDSKRFDGTIQHVQIHSEYRSDEWVSHEHDQLSDNSTFWGSPSWVEEAGGTTAPTAVFSGPFGGPMIGCF